MPSRLTWILSLGLNAGLAIAAAALWVRVHQAHSPVAAAVPDSIPALAVGEQPAGDPGDPASAALAPTNVPEPLQFHWSQIESDDYPQYIANLRAVGCPERLIRDLIVADLDHLYTRRRQAVRAPPLPPWAGTDARGAAEEAHRVQLDALEEEHQAVLHGLLGFAWNREAIELWNNEQIAWALLGFLSDDQAVKVAGLVESLTDQARRVRDRAEGILLDEDVAVLEELASRFDRDVAALLTPQQTEEFKLRLQALGLALSGRSLHFETAELTAFEVREIVRLSLAQADFVREELLDLEVPEEERAARQAVFETKVSAMLGPAREAIFTRAQDERFRDAYEFGRERNLPADVAVKAWEIRRAAEAEAEALQSAQQQGVAPGEIQQQLQALQESAAVALTTLFGAEHMAQYLEQQGEWLNQVGPPPAVEPSKEER